MSEVLAFRAAVGYFVHMSFLSAREFGSRTGGGGVASASQSNVDRRERLRQLALETIDLQKVCAQLSRISIQFWQDPYFMKNHFT